MLIHSLSSRKIVKLAAHPDGQHYLALSSNGEVFSWGCGDGGRLGHGDATLVTFQKSDESTMCQSCKFFLDCHMAFQESLKNALIAKL